MSRRRLLECLVGLAALGVLAWLGSRAFGVDLAAAATYEEDLARLLELEVLVHREVLEVRHADQHHYDDLSGYVREYRGLASGLPSPPPFLEAADREALSRWSAGLPATAARVEAQVEVFKTTNAQLKSWLRALPGDLGALEEWAGRARGTPVTGGGDPATGPETGAGTGAGTGRARVAAFGRDLLAALVLSDARRRSDLRRRLEGLDEATASPGTPEATVLRRARAILGDAERLDAMERALGEVLAASPARRLARAYPAGLATAIETADRHLLAFAALTGVLGLAFVLQLADLLRTRAELRQVNADLEARVESRTRELADAAARLARARDEALAASRAKGLFLARVGHELRTPLNAIIGYAEMLKEIAEEEGEDRALPDLERIRTAGRHLLEVINEILDVSRLESGRAMVDLSCFSVADLVENVCTTSRPLAERNGNRLSWRCADGVGFMRSDALKVRQVLFNLLSNACKFTRDGCVDVSAERSAPGGRQHVVLRVADTGIGLEPDQLERIFEPFEQVDPGLSRRFGGTGLGLAITRQLCTLLGGRVDATSTAGQGSEFVVVLPASLDGQAALEPAERETALREDPR